MHTQTDEGHFYSRPLPTSGDKFKMASCKRHSVTKMNQFQSRVFVVVLLFYVHGKHLRSCWNV